MLYGGIFTDEVAQGLCTLGCDVVVSKLSLPDIDTRNVNRTAVNNDNTLEKNETTDELCCKVAFLNTDEYQTDGNTSCCGGNIKNKRYAKACIDPKVYVERLV